MNRDSLLYDKPTDEDIIKDITPFVLDEAHEAEMQRELEGRILLATRVQNLVIEDPPNVDGLLGLVRSNSETLNSMISLIGLSQENFKRLITVLRIHTESFDSEWSLNRIAKEMTTRRDFGTRILNMLFYGPEEPELREKIPQFLLMSLDIAKLRMEADALIDTLMRTGIKGRYDAKKGKTVEDSVEKVLQGCNVEFLLGEITVTGIERQFDFVIPNKETPHVLIEVGVFMTTARELSEKGVMEMSLYLQMQEEYPDAVMVRVLDGVGWIARGGSALANVINAADYVLTQTRIDRLEEIVKQHVPEEFFKEPGGLSGAQLILGIE